MSPHNLFVAGTDTGVGKTVVSAALVRSLRQRHPRVAAVKPVVTGADPAPGGDTRALCRALGDDTPPMWAKVTGWTFAEPAAPPVAARAAGVRLDFGAIVAFVRDTADGASATVCEGVGGLLCPLTDEHTIADLAAELGWPVVLVARRSLGTLNHTLCAVEIARRRGLTLAGVVVNSTTPLAGLAELSAADELRRWLSRPEYGVRVVAELPHRADAEVSVFDEFEALLAGRGCE